MFKKIEALGFHYTEDGVFFSPDAASVGKQSAMRVRLRDDGVAIYIEGHYIVLNRVKAYALRRVLMRYLKSQEAC